MRPVSNVQYDFYQRRMPELIARFPHLFNKMFPEPLAIGTTKVIAELTDFTEFEVSQLLYVWCGRHEYLCMATSVGSRVGVDGSMSLMHPQQRRGFEKAVLQLNPKRLEHFAYHFRVAYQMNAFSSFTADENPLLTGLCKTRKDKHFDAYLTKAEILHHRDEEDELHRAIAFGNIYEDKMTTGNHPFRDGKFILTSAVKKVYQIAQVWFIDTMNTTYRVMGELKGSEDLPVRKFTTPPPRPTTVTGA